MSVFREAHGANQCPSANLLSPPLAGGDKGEGETRRVQNTYYFITPTLILPRQGGGDYCVSGWTLMSVHLEIRECHC
jgi:hypothetical protein